jgi:hypothetical protein
MSMRETLFGDYPIPDDTRQVAQAAFPKGNLYLQLRDRFGMLFTIGLTQLRACAPMSLARSLGTALLAQPEIAG